MGIIKYVVGERGNPIDLAASLLTGLALAGLVAARIERWDWQAIVLLLLAADIGAGLVSNATKATHDSWRENASTKMFFWFVFIHITVYPLTVFVLTRGDSWLAGILLLILMAKVMLFWSGQRACRNTDR